MTKFIYVTGGVISSIGKGIVSASLSAILEDRGLKTTIMKLDPYLNVDPGTMSPFQHGEVFVTNDGCETDLDLGHYERFISTKMSANNSVTSGQIYSQVIKNERKGEYLGGTVQVVPHVVDEVKRRVYKAAEGYDVIVVEVGGTVGDIESLPFLEAIRQMKSDLGVDDTAFIHLTFVPYISSAGELKTKPSQHSVRDMLALGLQPDVLVCRSENSIDEESKNKISLFTNVARECVIGLEDVNSIYLVPDILREHKLDEVILKKLNLSKPPAELKQWKKVANIINAKSDTKIKVGLVCKYNKLKDAYLSLIESVKHASMHFGTECEIIMIDSEDNHLELVEELKTLDGIIVPGGFGKRGVEGKIEAIKFARENKIPFLGICLGMQLVVIEYARNICNLSDANSSEFDKNSNNQVIGLIEQWQVDSEESKIVNKENLGGTMRLGAQNIKLKENLIFSNAYKSNLISERHRHRFEFNNNYKKVLEENNLIISGISEFGGLVETVELSKKDHPWFAACQFHPEFTSSPINGHPLFISFLEAVINK